MAALGVDFLVGIKSTLEGTYTIIGGQRGATLSMTTDAIDLTSKDSDFWEENTPGIRHWSIDFDGLLTEGEAGCVALESAFMAQTQLYVQMQTTAGNTYSGMATLTDLSYEAPYDGEATYSGTLQGTGELTGPTYT